MAWLLTFGKAEPDFLGLLLMSVNFNILYFIMYCSPRGRLISSGSVPELVNPVSILPVSTACIVSSDLGLRSRLTLVKALMRARATPR